ncbi:unnamed protein product [Pylaiella littoralis]
MGREMMMHFKLCVLLGQQKKQPSIHLLEEVGVVDNLQGAESTARNVCFLMVLAVCWHTYCCSHTFYHARRIFTWLVLAREIEAFDWRWPFLRYQPKQTEHQRTRAAAAAAAVHVCARRLCFAVIIVSPKSHRSNNSSK